MCRGWERIPARRDPLQQRTHTEVRGKGHLAVTSHQAWTTSTYPRKFIADVHGGRRRERPGRRDEKTALLPLDRGSLLCAQTTPGSQTIACKPCWDRHIEFFAARAFFGCGAVILCAEMRPKPEEVASHPRKGRWVPTPGKWGCEDGEGREATTRRGRSTRETNVSPVR